MGGTRKHWRPSPGDEAEGVSIREFGTGPRIELYFRYKGVRCRELLKFEVTAGNWQYAVRLRAEILNEIERDKFRYGERFPNSPRACLFGYAPTQKTVGDILREYLKFCATAVERGNMSPSTYDGYRKIIEGLLIPEFDKIRLADFTKSHVKEFIRKQNCTAKTIRNMLSPLRCALAEFADGLLDANPLDGLDLNKTIEKVAKESTFVVDPFDPLEREAFLTKGCRNDEERDMYIFWFETGLRPGELIGLAWPKVDWVHVTARIDTSVYKGIEKLPKTKAGIRDVDLTPAALAALERQKARTFLAGGRVWRTPYALAGADHRQAEQTPWFSDAQLWKVSYSPVLRRAGIRYRNMYQVRHTYASSHASRGANLFWLARQLGHETIEMVIRHYARWIPGMGTEQQAEGAFVHVASTPKTGAQILRFKPRS